MVQYYKHPRTPHWRHEVLRLGEDRHGVWLGAPAGSIVQPPRELPRPWDKPYVQLVVADQWWTMLYNGDLWKYRYYVDIVTPPEWNGDGQVEFVDLDLDVVMYQDGQVAILDEDEFREHSRHYPADVVERARSATREVQAALTAGAPPFDGAADEWLARVAGA